MGSPGRGREGRGRLAVPTAWGSHVLTGVWFGLPGSRAGSASGLGGGVGGWGDGGVWFDLAVRRRESPAATREKAGLQPLSSSKARKRGRVGSPEAPRGHSAGETFHGVPLGLLFFEALKCNT